MELPPTTTVFVDLALALGLGLLVGLQREWADTRVAGIRTFPLITLFGTLTGLLALAFGGWPVVAGFLALGAVVVMGDLSLLRIAEVRGEEPDPGLTTEAAALVMFAVGALLPLGYRGPRAHATDRGSLRTDAGRRRGRAAALAVGLRGGGPVSKSLVRTRTRSG